MSSSVYFRSMNKISRLYFLQSPVKRSVQNVNTIRMLANISISKKKEKETFINIFPLLTETLIKSPKFAKHPQIGNWMKKILEYNMCGGKQSRGLATVYTYEMIEKPENITEESMKLARIMGWCVEMLHTHLVLFDDIMDGSTTRRGVSCWYRLPDVGLGAINDAALLHMAMFHILKIHFSQRSCYAKILDVFHDTLLNTSIGQHYDYMMAHRNKNDYTQFTIERYRIIADNKTAYYTFKLPVCLGLLHADKTDHETHKLAEDVTMEIGQFFQIQDDYIDCFSDESITGKVGTDIQEGKCTWLAVMALQRCNAEQRSLFEQCYGSSEPIDVQRIKQLYETLELPLLYKEYERNVYNRVLERANNAASGALPSALILRLFNLIHKRKG
uniref:Farnesyl pyrophosphate synthase n=1 Tax=Chilo suppressalis TaxID=168631 RepID=A0A1W5ZM49_CHISP|nr:farnesyl diphosphate synthase 2 [Chilo suppressalis]